MTRTRYYYDYLSDYLNENKRSADGNYFDAVDDSHALDHIPGLYEIARNLYTVNNEVIRILWEATR